MNKLKSYLFYCLIIGLFFFGIYPTTNYIAQFKLLPHYSIFWEKELSIPLIPEMIFIYLSFYILFFLPYFMTPNILFKSLAKSLIWGTVFCGIIFILFPGDLGFQRVIPEHFGFLYENIFSIDKPFNLFPSLHVVYSFIICFYCSINKNTFVKFILLLWFLLISASTILVHQHHIFDVISAIILSILIVLINLDYLNIFSKNK